MLVPFNGTAPQVDPSAWVHPAAQIIGDVVIGPESSVWPYVVIRGDVHYVRIGARTNIQDAVVIHVTTARWPALVGDDVTVGHRAVLHGCTIGNGCLIGIGAIVLDGVEVGDHCLVGAGALLTPGTKIPPGHLVLGAPAKVVRALTEQEIESNTRNALHYVSLASHYREAGIR
ncbi:MAG: gamma carbonic anhydrase family protein [Candidatus Binatia bacterium]|nr:gamma carbonic anhydrase family protein [Candidatus Binatia bacterium]